MTKFFISPGDPSGIGPEITLKALSKNKNIQDNFILYHFILILNLIIEFNYNIFMFITLINNYINNY